MSVCSSGLKRESYRESGGLAVNLSIMRLYLKLYVCVCVCACVCVLFTKWLIFCICAHRVTQPNPAKQQSSTLAGPAVSFLLFSSFFLFLLWDPRCPFCHFFFPSFYVSFLSSHSSHVSCWLCWLCGSVAFSCSQKLSPGLCLWFVTGRVKPLRHFPPWASGCVRSSCPPLGFQHCTEFLGCSCSPRTAWNSFNRL